MSPDTEYLGQRPKRGEREGSWWSGGARVGKQRARGMEGAWRVLLWPRPASTLLPEHRFRPFLNMNQDADSSLDNSGSWINSG